MADFCSICEPDFFDINLTEIALELDPGRSESFICEGCNLRAVFKNESNALYLGRLVDGELVLEPIHIEDL